MSDVKQYRLRDGAGDQRERCQGKAKSGQSHFEVCYAYSPRLLLPRQGRGLLDYRGSKDVIPEREPAEMTLR